MESDFNPGAFRTRKKLLLGRLSELAAPVLRIAANVWSEGAMSPPRTWRNGLILSHNHIGDILYRTSSLSRLRESFPECQWTFLTTAQGEEVLQANPAIDSILTYCTGEDSWDLSSTAFFALRAKAFDVVLCTNSVRHYPDVMLAAALGIPNRVGYTYKGLSGLINHPIPISFPSAFPSYFRSMVAHLSGHEPDWSLMPQLVLRSYDAVKANHLWNELGLSESRPCVVCSLTTRQAVANWPPSLLLSIIAEARRSAQFDIVFAGTAGEAAAIHALVRDLPFRSHVVAGQLNVREFAVFLQKCRALLSLDSGARHIANAVGTRVFFLHNPAVSKIETGRYCDNEVDLAPPVEYLSASEVSRESERFDVSGAARELLRVVKEEREIQR